MVVESMVECG